jgi:hypothetical protein
MGEHYLTERTVLPSADYGAAYSMIWTFLNFPWFLMLGFPWLGFPWCLAEAASLQSRRRTLLAARLPEAHERTPRRARRSPHVARACCRKLADLMRG